MHLRRFLVSVGAALALSSMVAGPGGAIVWCHDYVWFKVTGKDANRTSPAALREELVRRGYKCFPYTNAARQPSAMKFLRTGDVIVFGDAHSAIVDPLNTIDHYLQAFGQSGKQVATAGVESLPNFEHDWTFDDFFNFYRRNAKLRKIFPFSTAKVEVWRAQGAGVAGKRC